LEHKVPPSEVTWWFKSGRGQLFIFLGWYHCFDSPSVLLHCYFGDSDGTWSAGNLCQMSVKVLFVDLCIEKVKKDNQQATVVKFHSK